MPGSVSLSLDDELLEGPVPGIGDPVPVRVKNTGTTVLTGISLTMEGRGADHIELSSDKRSWSEAGEAIELTDMKPGSSTVVYARVNYMPDDSEDREKLRFIVSATSTG